MTEFDQRVQTRKDAERLRYVDFSELCTDLRRVDRDNHLNRANAAMRHAATYCRESSIPLHRIDLDSLCRYGPSEYWRNPPSDHFILPVEDDIVTGEVLRRAREFVRTTSDGQAAVRSMLKGLGKSLHSDVVSWVMEQSGAVPTEAKKAEADEKPPAAKKKAKPGTGTRGPKAQVLQAPPVLDVSRSDGWSWQTWETALENAILDVVARWKRIKGSGPLVVEIANHIEGVDRSRVIAVAQRLSREGRLKKKVAGYTKTKAKNIERYETAQETEGVYVDGKIVSVHAIWKDESRNRHGINKKDLTRRIYSLGWSVLDACSIPQRGRLADTKTG